MSSGLIACPTRAMSPIQSAIEGLRSNTGSSSARPADMAMANCTMARSETPASRPPFARIWETRLMALSHRRPIRCASTSHSLGSMCARVNASSSRMSQLAAGLAKTSCAAASMTAMGGASPGSSTADATRSAADELTRSAITASNNSARLPVSRRTVALLTPAAFATMLTLVPLNPYSANRVAAASRILARSSSSDLAMRAPGVAWAEFLKPSVDAVASQSERQRGDIVHTAHVAAPPQQPPRSRCLTGSSAGPRHPAAQEPLRVPAASRCTPPQPRTSPAR